MLKYYIPLFILLSLCPLFAKSSVWKVSKGHQSLYIGGTCHILRASDYPLPPEFEDAYNSAETLVFEIDPSIINHLDFTSQLLRATGYTDERNLKFVLSQKTYQKLTERCKQNGFSIEMFDKTKPSMVMTMLMVKELAKFDVNEQGVDLHYYKRGLEDQKKIQALESAEFHIELITSLNEGVENSIICYGLQDIENLQNNFYMLVSAWRRGDIAKINEYFVENLRKYPQLHQKLLMDRNKQWVNSLENFMSTAEIEFVLVGVSHMAGEHGLLSLLQRKGYTIKQINVSR